MRSLPTFSEREVSHIIQYGYGMRVLEVVPLRHVFRVETNLGPRFFKPFHLNETRLQLIAIATEHLSEQGFHSLVRFLPTIDGKPYYRQGSQLYYMTNWIEGHPCSYDNPFELKRAVQLFAEFHQAARGFAQNHALESYLGKWPEIFQKRTTELAECYRRAREVSKPTDFEECFLSKINFYLAEAEKAQWLLEESDYAQLCRIAREELPFCHHDPAHHNILFTAENEPILIDFDYLIQDLHLHDLASIIIRNGKASGWNLKRSEFLLKAYHHIRPIMREELGLMKAFITFPFDIWAIAKARYLDECSWPLGYYLKEWERKTRDEGARQEFLGEFEDLGER